MILGLLPAIRGGLGDLARTGQHTRFIDGYLRRYVAAFDEVRYFSYDRETLDRFTTEAALRDRVRVFPGGPWHPWLYTFLLTVRHRRALRGCSVLRVFQATGVVPALMAKRWLGTPFVTTYGFWYERLARSRGRARLHRVVERLGLRHADAVIVTTPELRDHVLAVAPGADVHLVPNGVDTDLFRPVPRAATPVPTVLYVGRLSAEKNLGLIVEAAAKLAGRLDVRVRMVGAGPERARLDALARRLGVTVDVRPFMEHRALPGVFADADAFVLPSTTEGHPKVLLEAMSAGVPCVASDVIGNRAIATDGETALLFAPGDATALAERLAVLLTDRGLARTVADRARARVLERYDLGRLVEREIALLRRVARAA